MMVVMVVMYTSKIQLVMVVVYVHQQDTVSGGGDGGVYTPASYS